MHDWTSMIVAKGRHEEFLRVAEDERLARGLRKARRERQGAGFEMSGDGGFVVRWGLPGDEARISRIMELNGMPRWVAFEERFIVAEKKGKVQGVLRYRTESKRLILGLLVVEPWAGEPRVAKALYTGAGALAEELGASEILAETPPNASYVAESGYVRRGRSWSLDPARSTGKSGPSTADGWVWARTLRETAVAPLRKAFRG